MPDDFADQPCFIILEGNLSHVVKLSIGSLTLKLRKHRQTRKNAYWFNGLIMTLQTKRSCHVFAVQNLGPFITMSVSSYNYWHVNGL